MPRLISLAAVLILFTVVSASGQNGVPEHHHATADPAPPSWSWTTDANLFAGENYQQRKFTDFSTFESQNWGMLNGTRPFWRGRLSLEGMASLEPFTMEALGSPQVFQTGEAYHGAPLIDRQHPHDLLMELAAKYTRSQGPVTLVAAGGLVGAPALGPTPFMHRESARDNPAAPLGHHYQDSTHTTPGFLTAGLQAGALTFEASAFRGQEPDDSRLDIERPWLDSWSARGAWQKGPWRAQFSGGVLRKPEPFDPYDVPRLTASVEFNGSIGSRPLSAAVIWGQNRETHGVLDGYLIEWDAALSGRTRLFGRAESVAKDILDLGAPDPPEFLSFHHISHVQALTLGIARDLSAARSGTLGIGADVTVYRVSDDLIEPYGSPHSVHVFLRYRPRPRISMDHVH